MIVANLDPCFVMHSRQASVLVQCTSAAYASFAPSKSFQGHTSDSWVQGVLDTKEDRARDKARAELADAYDDFDMKVEQHWTEKVCLLGS